MIAGTVSEQTRLALEKWRDTQNQAEIDPDGNLTDLVPVIARLIGWLCEPETCERRGMRATALAEAVRPDFNEGKSLGRMSPRSKRNLDNLITDFRQTFRTSDSSKE